MYLHMEQGREGQYPPVQCFFSFSCIHICILLIDIRMLVDVDSFPVYGKISVFMSELFFRQVSTELSGALDATSADEILEVRFPAWFL